MAEVKQTVGNLMVKSPITVEPWQPVAHARQLMLMHSFSALPIWREPHWWLLTELTLARFLNVSRTKRRKILGLTIEEAFNNSPKLELAEIHKDYLYTPETTIDEVLRESGSGASHSLWLVIDGNCRNHLVGVLSPFELM